MTPQPAHAELDTWRNRNTRAFAEIMHQYAAALFAGDVRAADDVSRRMRLYLSTTMTGANLLGRRRVLMEYDAAKTRSLFAGSVSQIPFKEGITALLEAEPRLAEDAEEVAELYRTGKVFALADSTEKALTEEIRDTIARLAKRGRGEATAGKVLAELGGFSESYARLVYRNNLSRAYHDGRHAQADDPEVHQVFPAFLYRTMRDANVRPEHKAADGLIAATDDPVWGHWTPPCDFNCRCALDFIDRWELKKRGLLLPNGSVKASYPRTWAKAKSNPAFWRAA